MSKKRRMFAAAMSVLALLAYLIYISYSAKTHEAFLAKDTAAMMNYSDIYLYAFSAFKVMLYIFIIALSFIRRPLLFKLGMTAGLSFALLLICHIMDTTLSDPYYSALSCLENMAILWGKGMVVFFVTQFFIYIKRQMHEGSA